MKYVNKILAFAIAIVLSISMLPTTNVDAAAKVKLNKKKATIYVGKTVTLKVKNNKKKVKWSSSNKKIATVSKKGKVKGKKAGKATITAKVGKKKYKCKVTVKKKVVKKPTVQPTQQPTTKPVVQTTIQQTIMIPTEVVGVTIVKQNKAEVSFMWSQNATQSNAGQSYKVYIDGVFYNQYPMPTNITYKFTSVGNHVIRITGVLNGLETTGVTLNVSVTDLGEIGGNTTTEQPTTEEPATEQPTTEEPTTEDLGDSGEDWIVEGSSTKVYIKGYIGTDTDIVIPSKILGKEVVGIRKEAFRNSNIESVIIPNSITTIEGLAFADCSKLTSITIPNSITTIEYDTFSRCSKLTSVTIPNSVTTIRTSAFYECSNLTSVTIPNSVTTIEEYAFAGCKNLKKLTIPKNIQYVGMQAFAFSKIEEIYMPNPEEEEGPFMYSEINKVIFYEGTTSVDLWVFYDTYSIDSIVIPDSVVEIEKRSEYHLPTINNILGKKGSYAEMWANENGYRFIAQ